MSKNMETDSLQERTVIGFDIRKSSLLNKLFLTSYDENVRYEDIYESLREYISPINLFFIDPACISELEIPRDSLIIAFDLPNDVVDSLLNGNVSAPRPLPEINIQEGWDFVGFDVVDPYTQTSALYGFDLQVAVNESLEKAMVSFNKFGLLEAIGEAEKIAQIYDHLIPGHAPFSPCGVWLKNKR